LDGLKNRSNVTPGPETGKATDLTLLLILILKARRRKYVRQPQSNVPAGHRTRSGRLVQL